MKPLVIELFAGLHGWGEGFIAEGYRAIGFDIVDMCAFLGVPRPAGCELVLQDVLTLHGSQFRNAEVIVASPPCQFFSRMAMPFKMPWSQAEFECRRDHSLALFHACFRIAEEAGGVPLIVENVVGAQKYVGRSRYAYRSFHLWGDVPALMPLPIRTKKTECPPVPMGELFRKTGQRVQRVTTGHLETDGLKFGGGWWHDSTNNLIRKCGSRSLARKAASAQIARIPFPLANWIARVYKPI